MAWYRCPEVDILAKTSQFSGMVEITRSNGLRHEWVDARMILRCERAEQVFRCCVLVRLDDMCVCVGCVWRGGESK